MKDQDSAAAWRVFCAIELPDHVRKLFVQHMATLRNVVPDARARWSRPENIHLTLKFFGDISLTEVENLRIAAMRAVEGSACFKIQVGETGMFPPHGAPRVLWIGVHDLSGKLAALHARLEDESEKVGFEKETRTFHPHLTLARFREPRRQTKQSRSNSNQLARTLVSAHMATPLPSMEITVSELLVMRSELGSTGSKYTVISRHPLFGVPPSGG